MKPLLLILLLAAPLTVSAAPDKDKPKLVRVHTERSGDYPITVRGTDSLENAALLVMAEEAYQTFLNVLGLEALPSFALKVTWDSAPLRPPYDSFAAFPRKVETAPDGTRVFTVMTQGPLADGNAADRQQILRENFYRSCMTCFVQALAQRLTVSGDGLAEPPFWLCEGLTQLMMKPRHEDYAKIARRYRQLQRLPSLEQMQNWDGFTDDFLTSRWRQAFAYWLVKFATRETASRRALTLWLGSGDYEQRHSFLDANPRNESWWLSGVGEAPPAFKPHDWRETQELFARHKQITVTLKPAKPGEPERRETLFIGDLPEPKRLADLQPVRAKIDELGNFQLRSHPALARIAEFYRLTLELWLTGEQSEYKKCIEATAEQETNTLNYMALVGDYMDWVMVNTAMDLRPVPNFTRQAQELWSADIPAGVMQTRSAN